MLKFNFRVLLVALASLALVTSCKDGEPAKENAFTYDGGSGNKIKTAVLYLDMTGFTSPASSQKVYFHELTLLGEGFTLTADGEAQGIGHAIALGVITASTSLEAGTYNLNLDESMLKANDLAGVIVFLNYNTTTGAGQRFEVSTTGKLVVSKSADTYTFSLDGVVNGKPTKAYFRGTVSVF